MVTELRNGNYHSATGSTSVWGRGAVIAATFGLLIGQTAQAKGAGDSFTLQWLGHAAFILDTGSETVLMDPFGEGLGYPVPAVSADIVTISHEHFDHNYIQAALGKPRILRGVDPRSGEWQNVQYADKSLTIRTVPVYHDDRSGQQRGKNAIFIFEVKGVTLAHLGDLGHPLSAGQVRAIGPVDILMIPVGGYYTIGGEQAVGVIEALKPRVVIPMHFNNGSAAMKSWPITDEKRFLAALPSGWTVRSGLGPQVTISADMLPRDKTVWVLRPPQD